MWFIVFGLGVVVARGLFPRVLCMGSPQTRELLSWSFSVARGQLQRNELDESWEVSGFSTPTGSMRLLTILFIYHIAVVVFYGHSHVRWYFEIVWCRIQLTNTLRSFWLTLLTMQSGMTQESIGSATLSTSAGSSVVSLLLGRNIGDCVERGISTTSNVLLAGQTGRETTPFLFVVTVEFGYFAYCVFIFLGIPLEETPFGVWNFGDWNILNHVLLWNST